MKENKKPKHLLILKIIGIAGLLCAVAGVILVITGFGNFENNNFMIGGFLATFGFFIGFLCTFIGFKPEITKLSTKTAKYIQEDNKSDLKDIVNTSADISSEAITKVSSSVKDGLKNKKFCKECGAEIDLDSKFCEECGKKQ